MDETPPTEEELERWSNYATAGWPMADPDTQCLIAAYRDAQIESVAQARRYIELDDENAALREALVGIKALPPYSMGEARVIAAAALLGKGGGA